MARPRNSSESGSLLRALDGSNLKWDKFREDVLLPFAIRVVSASELENIPQALVPCLQDRLKDLSRFDQVRNQWRSQTTAGQGFDSPTIFPPNVLPPESSPGKVQRCLQPKMSREGLPRRARPAPLTLFELPTARPIYATGFTTACFTEAEHVSVPCALSPTGTFINFSNGVITAGQTVHFPFLTFERCAGDDEDDIEIAQNMCAIAGSQCLKGLLDTTQRAFAPGRTPSPSYAFSCTMNNALAIINLHTINNQGQYTMSALCRFDLNKDDHFNTFQAWIQAIEDWATMRLLPNLKDDLTKLNSSESTPPASPMPSLTLSVDTEVGAISGLLSALRGTFPNIPWKSDQMADTPINSSVANCGTPATGRKLQALAFSPSSPISTNLMARRGKISAAIAPLRIQRKGTWDNVPARPSPFSPRYGCISASAIDPLSPTSPCRPGTLSPFTPPPDQPWAAKNPMLVLQRRVDVAMNEIQELRSQMEMIQTELSIKTQQLTTQLSVIPTMDDMKKLFLEAAAKPQEKEKEQEPEKEKEKESESLPMPAPEPEAPTIQIKAELTPSSLTLRSQIEPWLPSETWDVILAQSLFFLLGISAVLAIFFFSLYQCFIPVLGHLWRFPSEIARSSLSGEMVVLGSHDTMSTSAVENWSKYRKRLW